MELDESEVTIALLMKVQTVFDRKKLLFAIPLVLAVFLLPLKHAASAASDHQFVNDWGSYAFSPGQFGSDNIKAELISADSTGSESKLGSYRATISADGNYVAFQSDSKNLIANDTNGTYDIFLKNASSGTIARINTSSAGEQANVTNGGSNFPSISADGRYVAFGSGASNFLAGDNNNDCDFFKKDTQAGGVTRASTSSSGTETHGYMCNYMQTGISADGRYVVFSSGAKGLVPDDTNDLLDVFVKDTTTSAISRVSTASDGNQSNGDSRFPVISADGRYIAYQSSASNLIAGDAPLWGVYIKDTATGNTTLVDSHSSWNPSISADGRFVAFDSSDSNVIPGLSSGSNVYIKDMSTGENLLISGDTTGVPGNEGSNKPYISADGRFVTFSSRASNFSGNEKNYYSVFVKDTLTGTIALLSADAAGGQANADSFADAISSDGKFIVFESKATNIATSAKNGYNQIFRVNNPLSDYHIQKDVPASQDVNSSQLNKALIVTSTNELRKMFAQDQVNNILAKAKDYGDIVDYDQIISSDYPDVASQINSLPDISEGLRQIHEGEDPALSLGSDARSLLIQTIYQIIKDKFDTTKYSSILILGGNNVVPMPDLSNPLSDLCLISEGESKFDDDILYSDDVYANLDGDENTVIDVPISRIEDGKDYQTVMAQLSPKQTPISGAFSLTSIDLVKAKDIGKLISADPMLESPPTIVGSYSLPINDYNYYFLVHGDKDYHRAWYGRWSGLAQCSEKNNAEPCQDPTKAIETKDAKAKGIVFAGVCYGGKMINETTDKDMGLSFLRNGATAYIASTGQSWVVGIPNSKKFTDACGGKFASTFFENEKKYSDPIVAFFHTKQDFASYIWSSSYPDPVDIKILHEFNFYGFPTF